MADTTMSRDSGGTSDVIDEILADHAEIKRLLSEVTDGRGSGRAAAFDELARIIAMHESAEQAVVHPEMEQLDDAVADKRLDEEAKGDEMLERLRSMSVKDPEFDALFAKFSTAVLRHAEHEEKEEHPKLRAGVDAERLTEMADEFIAAEDEADPTSGK
ncbi:MAG: hemerythrin domain-containing protein [Acidimicrobiales bacterium]